MNDLALAHFVAMWDALPDRTTPPTDGPFYPGDICKINGKAWVWLDDRWQDAQEVHKQRFVIEVDND